MTNNNGEEPHTFYDPPSGHRYGFPKIYNPLPNEKLADTLLRDGYPQKELDWGAVNHVRFWGKMVEDQFAKTFGNYEKRVETWKETYDNLVEGVKNDND